MGQRANGRVRGALLECQQEGATHKTNEINIDKALDIEVCSFYSAAFSAACAGLFVQPAGCQLPVIHVGAADQTNDCAAWAGAGVDGAGCLLFGASKVALRIARARTEWTACADSAASSVSSTAAGDVRLVWVCVGVGCLLFGASKVALRIARARTEWTACADSAASSVSSTAADDVRLVWVCVALHTRVAVIAASISAAFSDPTPFSSAVLCTLFNLLSTCSGDARHSSAARRPRAASILSTLLRSKLLNMLSDIFSRASGGADGRRPSALSVRLNALCVRSLYYPSPRRVGGPLAAAPLTASVRRAREQASRPVHHPCAFAREIFTLIFPT
jgi:hypothetical protein